MAKRERPAEASKRPAHAIEAGKANLAKGREARKAKARKAEEAGIEPIDVRWAKLLDGTMTVKDMDDQELARMRLRNSDGSFAGRGRPVPSHLIQAMQKEAIARAQDKFRAAAPEAVALLIDIGSDPEVQIKDRVAALKFVVERALGRMPETVRIEGTSKFDQMLDDALGLPLDRDVSDGASVDG